MADMNGIRLIRRTLSSGNFFYSLPDCMIDYQPKIEYKINKTNAFDPTILHRRSPYHVDTLSLKTPITPTLYRSLYAFLIAETLTLYVEFTLDGVLRQYSITLTQLPACPDDLHEYPAEISLVAESRYTDPLTIINFDLVALMDTQQSYV
jgi:hypothetical protein